MSKYEGVKKVEVKVSSSKPKIKKKEGKSLIPVRIILAVLLLAVPFGIKSFAGKGGEKITDKIRAVILTDYKAEEREYGEFVFLEFLDED